jgi:hypothetical protein
MAYSIAWSARARINGLLLAWPAVQMVFGQSAD